MAKSTVKFNCGCGYTATNPLEAVLHVDSTGHTMEAVGELRPDNGKNKKEK